MTTDFSRLPVRGPGGAAGALRQLKMLTSAVHTPNRPLDAAVQL